MPTGELYSAIRFLGRLRLQTAQQRVSSRKRRAQQDHPGFPRLPTELETEEPPSAFSQGVSHMLKLH